MSSIHRKGVGPVLSTSVEYHGFVYLAGLTADDLSQDVSGQTAQVLAKIDAALEEHGTLNRLWTAWLPAGGAPVRACVEANMADPRHLVEIMVSACR